VKGITKTAVHILLIHFSFIDDRICRAQCGEFWRYEVGDEGRASVAILSDDELGIINLVPNICDSGGMANSASLRNFYEVCSIESAEMSRGWRFSLDGPPN
jgi:hypothetical protein